MIVTKTQQIKEMEKNIQKLMSLLTTRDKTILLLNEIIEKLENKVKNQCKEINNLRKRI